MGISKKNKDKKNKFDNDDSELKIDDSEYKEKEENLEDEESLENLDIDDEDYSDSIDDKKRLDKKEGKVRKSEADKIDTGDSRRLTKDKKKGKTKKDTKKQKKVKRFTNESNNVHELFKNNTDHILNSKDERFLIFLYKSFNNKSANMNTIFNKLSLEKDKSIIKIKFYKGNAKLIRKFSDKIGAIEFPSIYLLAKDQDAIYDYNGKINVDSLITFIHKMTKINIEEAKSLNHFKSIAKHGSNILFIGDINKHQKSIYTIAKYSKKYFKNAFWTKSEEFSNKFNIKKGEMDAIAYFTVNKTLNDGERMNFTPDEYNKDEILKISEVYSRSPLSWLNHHKLDYLIHFKLKAVIFLYKDLNDKQSKDIDNVIVALSKKYRENYYFLKAKMEMPISELVVELFHLEGDNEIPRVMVIDNKSSNNIDLDLYVIPKNTELNEKNIENFILSNIKERLLISDPIRTINPTLTEEEKLKHKQSSNFTTTNYTDFSKNVSDQEFYIEDVIGFNFEQVVFNNPGNDVVLYVCTDSSFCRASENRVRKAFKKLSNNTKLVLRHLNYIMNEAPGINITHVPALYLIPDISVNEVKKVIQFSSRIHGNFTTNNIVKFVQENVVNKIEYLLKLDNELKIEKLELKKKIRIRTRQEDEEDMEIEHGFPLGNGCTRTINRWNYHYNEENKSNDESIEHDAEDYDQDEAIYIDHKEEL